MFSRTRAGSLACGVSVLAPCDAQTTLWTTVKTSSEAVPCVGGADLYQSEEAYIQVITNQVTSKLQCERGFMYRRILQKLNKEKEG